MEEDKIGRHETRMGNLRKGNGCEGRDHLGYAGADRGIILRWNPGKYRMFLEMKRHGLSVCQRKIKTLATFWATMKLRTPLPEESQMRGE